MDVSGFDARQLCDPKSNDVQEPAISAHVVTFESRRSCERWARLRTLVDTESLQWTTTS